MKLKLNQAERWAFILTVSNWGIPLIILFVSGTMKIESSRWPQVIQPFINFVQYFGWLVILFLSLILPFVQWFKAKIGTETKWQAVHLLLEQFKSQISQNLKKKNTSEHDFRVTLFEHRKWVLHPFRRNIMVAVARTGHSTHDGIPFFYATADTPNKSEGIAGRAWADNKVYLLQTLPDLNKEGVTDEEKKEYAKHTMVTCEWIEARLKQGKKFPMCMGGFRLMYKGKPWGSIVVDSMEVKSVNQSKFAYDSKELKAFVEMLNKLLDL